MKQNQSNLYQDRFEHDACGIGAVVSIDGIQEHKVLDDALTIVEKLEHRAGKDATGQVGDGVGILTQISHSFFKKLLLRWESVLEKPVITESACSFFRRIR